MSQATFTYCTLAHNLANCSHYLLGLFNLQKPHHLRHHFDNGPQQHNCRPVLLHSKHPVCANPVLLSSGCPVRCPS
eukprot:scaffold114189_cov17-Tisochrysis_lutea.AAC.2